jgi:carbon monoxide dehydrogenase subunit G
MSIGRTQLIGCGNQMAQIEVTASAVIGVPPAEIWELISDTSRYAEWVAGTAEVTRTDGPAREGSTYDEINPIMGPWRAKTRWTVTEFDPPRRQVHRTEDVPFASAFLVIIDLAPSGDGSEVTVTLRATPSLGVVGATVHRILKSQTRRDNERTVRKLAELATAS